MGLSFLSITYGLSSEMASFGIASFFVGLIIGCPTLGIIINQTGKVKSLMIISSFMTMMTLILITFP